MRKGQVNFKADNNQFKYSTTSYLIYSLPATAISIYEYIQGLLRKNTIKQQNTMYLVAITVNSQGQKIENKDQLAVQDLIKYLKDNSFWLKLLIIDKSAIINSVFQQISNQMKRWNISVHYFSLAHNLYHFMNEKQVTLNEQITKQKEVQYQISSVNEEIKKQVNNFYSQSVEVQGYIANKQRLLVNAAQELEDKNSLYSDNQQKKVQYEEEVKSTHEKIVNFLDEEKLLASEIKNIEKIFKENKEENLKVNFKQQVEEQYEVIQTCQDIINKIESLHQSTKDKIDEYSLLKENMSDLLKDLDIEMNYLFSLIWISLNYSSSAILLFALAMYDTNNFSPSTSINLSLLLRSDINLAKELLNNLILPNYIEKSNFDNLEINQNASPQIQSLFNELKQKFNHTTIERIRNVKIYQDLNNLIQDLEENIKRLQGEE
ncbi:hypothetical protein ABPG72_012691 [Tetrahymena utriculariae]